MDAREIIELVLASLMGIFLILLIVIAVFFVKIVRSVAKASHRVANIAEDLESVSQKIYWSKEPFKIIKAILGLFAGERNHSKKRSKW